MNCLSGYQAHTSSHRSHFHANEFKCRGRPRGSRSRCLDCSARPFNVELSFGRLRMNYNWGDIWVAVCFDLAVLVILFTVYCVYLWFVPTDCGPGNPPPRSSTDMNYEVTPFPPVIRIPLSPPYMEGRDTRNENESDEQELEGKRCA